MRNYKRFSSAGRGSILKHHRGDNVQLYAILDGEGTAVSIEASGFGWSWAYHTDTELGAWEWVYIAPKKRIST